MTNQTFDFVEALKRMKEGKKVRRRVCQLSLPINKDKEKLILYRHWDFFFLDDILATDWEEVEG